MNPVKEKEFLDLLIANSLIVKKVCCMYFDTEEDKKDLEQEIFLQLWRAYSNFKGESKFSTWLYKVALNTAITFFKKQKRKDNEQEICQEFYEVSNNMPDIHKNEQLERLHSAISMLSKSEKAFVMLYIDEKGYDEIAEILGITPGNARVKLARIKEKLKQNIKN